MVLAEAGERLGGNQVADKEGRDHEVYHGVPYELNFSIEADQEISPWEAKRLVNTAVRKWLEENPDHTVHYLSVSELSDKERTSLGLSAPAYSATVQVTTQSPQLVAALVVAGIAVLGVAWGAIGYGAVLVGFIAAYAIFRAVDYILGPETFQCPKNPEHGTFNGIGNLGAHLEAKHPDQPQTNQDIMDQAEKQVGTDWKTLIKWGVVGVVGAAVISKI